MKFARARLRLRGGADLDLSERERRRRQDAHVDRAADSHRLPGEPGRLGLEIGAVLFPVDEMRPHQRCYQRQNDRHTDPEQGCLQSVLRAPSARIPGRPCPHAPNDSELSVIMAANICRAR
jgi:hypothetical protein